MNRPTTFACLNDSLSCFTWTPYRANNINAITTEIPYLLDMSSRRKLTVRQVAGDYVVVI